MQHPSETIRFQTQKKKTERRKTEVERESFNENNEQQCNLNEQKKILINLNRNVKSEKKELKESLASRCSLCNKNESFNKTTLFSLLLFYF